jgi:hypothetical protein
LVVVSVSPADVDDFDSLCRKAGVPATPLGVVGGADLVIVGSSADAASGGRGFVLQQPPRPPVTLRVPIAALQEVYESALPRALGE